MKRELVLRIGGEEVTVTVWRDGAEIVVSREGREHRIGVLSESVVGLQETVQRPTGVSTPNAEAGTGGRTSTEHTSSQSRVTKGREGTVTAPMTGVIDQVLVEDGAAVQSGDTIVVLEAMKMFIDVQAPIAGTVREIVVQVGDTVQEGRALLRIE